MLRKILWLTLCVSLLLATTTAASSGNDEPEVRSLASSEAVPFPKVSEDPLGHELDLEIQQYQAKVAAFYAAVKAEEQRKAAEEAERLRAEQEAAQQAEAERERQAAQEAPPAPPPTNVSASGGCATNPDAGGCWDKLAQCESGGDWHINTGNGYSGGLQFHPQTWTGHGGGEFAPEAWQASREQQIVIGRRVWQSQGWGAWPACTASFGWR